jgi:hypothetical protein
VLSVWVLGRDQFAFQPILIVVFAVLTVVAVAMQRGVVTKPSTESFWDRMAGVGSSSSAR